MIQKPKGKDVIDHISTKTQKLIYTLNKRKKEIKYYIQSDDGESKPYEEILFKGFEKLPSGVYSEGFGITTGGWLIDKQLKEAIGETFFLIISAIDLSSIKRSGKTFTVTLNFKDLKKLQERLREIKSAKNKESDNAGKYYLNKFFPTYIKPPKESSENIYSSGDIAGVLTSDGILDNLSSQDIKALDDFYPDFYNHSNKKLSSDKRFLKITKDKQEAEVVYLENIIVEFEKKLKQNLPESSWQTFLREYILLFNTNYTDHIEKANINILGTKFPDFMLIDVYNYLDVYEIKKPSTVILKEDSSRGNYYWDTEISKAISQVENYIHVINKNGSAFREEVKRSKKLEIRVVKPRGIIIAGTSNQFKGNEIIEDNFRLLNQSLKNVEIILYDELLTNLKIFLARLKTE